MARRKEKSRIVAKTAAGRRPVGKRPERRGGWVRVVAGWIVLGMLMTGAAFGAIQTQPEWMMEAWTRVQEIGDRLETPPMPITDWRIECGPRITESEIKRIVVSEGDALWKLEIESVQRRLSRLEWAREVAVRRNYPDQLEIIIKERVPVALTRQPELAYLDEEGRIIAPAPAEALEEYPVVQRWFDSPGETSEKVGAEGEAVAFLTRLDREGVLEMAQVSEVSIGSSELRLMTVGGLEIRVPRQETHEAVSRLANVFEWCRTGPEHPESVLGIRIGIGGRVFVTTPDGEKSGPMPLKI